MAFPLIDPSHQVVYSDQYHCKMCIICGHTEHSGALMGPCVGDKPESCDDIVAGLIAVKGLEQLGSENPDASFIHSNENIFAGQLLSDSVRTELMKGKAVPVTVSGMEVAYAALLAIASETQVYTGHGNVDVSPALSAEEAQEVARMAIEHIENGTVPT